jgi:hypothetical protein
MPLEKGNKLGKRLYHVIITVLEDDVEGWIYRKSGEVARKVEAREEIGRLVDLWREKFTPGGLSSRRPSVNEEVVRKFTDSIVRRLEDKIISKKYIVLAKGKLVEGEEKRFITLEVPQFLEFVTNEIYDQALAKLGFKMRDTEDYGDYEDYDWWRRGTVKKGEKEEFFEYPSMGLNAFERSLESPILTVYEEDIRDFVEGIAERVANWNREGADDYDIYYDTVDEVRENVDRVREDIERWGSHYVNVIKGSSSTKEGICKIFYIDDFCEKLSSVSKRWALKLAGITDEEFYEPISDNYFDEEFFV